MERRSKDPKRIKNIALFQVSVTYPDLTDEEKLALAKTKKWLDWSEKSLMLDDFRDKIYYVHEETITLSYSRKWAERIVNNMPQELWPNIDEWIDDKPISDIKVHGVSIPDIMYHLSRGSVDFLSAMTRMIAWQDSGFPDKAYFKILSMRM